MTVEMIVVLALILVAVVLFASEKLPVDLVALLVMAVLLLSGIITPAEGIAGFSNEATVTVGAMFILSAALYKTGAINSIGTLTTRIFKFNFWVGMIAMMVLVGILSAFVNNTPVVAIFIPILMSVAKEMKRSPARFLMPLSFASMFGGVCTLIGTSTNILLNSIAVNHGQPPFGMFEFTALGFIFFLGGSLYMLLFGIHMIPQRGDEGELTKTFGMGEYLTEIVILAESDSIGSSALQSVLVRDTGVEILEVMRNGMRLKEPLSRIKIQVGDILQVIGDVAKIKRLQERQGIRLKAEHSFHDKDIETEDTVLAEAIIAPQSLLERKTLKETRFRNMFGVTALAIRRRDRIVHTKLGAVKLQAGDALLLKVSKSALEELRKEDAFVFVSEVGLPQFRKEKIPAGLLIAAGVVMTASLGILPIVVSAIVGCVLMVLVGCLTLEEAYKAIDWKVIFLLAGALTLGVAMEKSGAAMLVSNKLVHAVGGWGPVAMVSVFFLLTTVLTNMMSNNATAVLLAPIAISAATSLNIDPRPLLMAVTFAASSSFMTPVGYQTNTMIYGAGKYRFKDFIIVGTPLNVLLWILATIFIPQFWPF